MERLTTNEIRNNFILADNKEFFDRMLDREPGDNRQIEYQEFFFLVNATEEIDTKDKTPRHIFLDLAEKIQSQIERTDLIADQTEHLTENINDVYYAARHYDSRVAEEFLNSINYKRHTPKPIKEQLLILQQTEPTLSYDKFGEDEFSDVYKKNKTSYPYSTPPTPSKPILDSKEHSTTASNMLSRTLDIVTSKSSKSNSLEKEFYQFLDKLESEYFDNNLKFELYDKPENLLQEYLDADAKKRKQIKENILNIVAYNARMAEADLVLETDRIVRLQAGKNSNNENLRVNKISFTDANKLSRLWTGIFQQADKFSYKIHKESGWNKTGSVYVRPQENSIEFFASGSNTRHVALAIFSAARAAAPNGKLAITVNSIKSKEYLRELLVVAATEGYDTNKIKISKSVENKLKDVGTSFDSIKAEVKRVTAESIKKLEETQSKPSIDKPAPRTKARNLWTKQEHPEKATNSDDMKKGMRKGRYI